jgi:mannose-6-phosphate isomerase-like protein (cupin superfamily)
MQRMAWGSADPVSTSDPTSLLFEGIGLTAPVRDSTFSLARTVLTAEGTVVRHFHRDSRETYVILRGTATMVVDGISLAVGEGDVILVEPGERHELLAVADEGIEFLAITVPPFRPEDFILDPQERTDA